MLVWVNGECIAANEARISLLDGGYLFGDGVFETLRLYQGQPFDLSGHLERMTHQLEVLEYQWRPDRKLFEAAILDLLSANNWLGIDARCRITVSRGFFEHESMPLTGHETLPPTVSIMVQPLGERLAIWHRDGIRVRTMTEDFARGNFPQLKTLNYLPTIMAMRRAHSLGCDEALLIDSDGWVLEGATSNVFMVSKGTLTTPPLSQGLLAGRTRAMVLDLAVECGLITREQPFRPQDLRAADEAFLCGSVKEIVPMVSLDDHPVGAGHPGAITQQLQKKYRRRVVESLDGIC